MNSESISAKVAESITNAAPKILDTVVEELAAKEITRRADALLAAINLAQSTQKELIKIDRPDIVPLSRDGKPAGEGSYSKARADEIKKLTEKLTKIDRAIDKATEKQDYGDVFNLKETKEPKQDSGESV